MSNTIKRFGYKIMKMKKTDDLPFDPIITLNLDRWTVGENEVPQVSPHLMTEGEIDWHIEALKADLDAVGRRAKRALNAAKVATAEIVAERHSN